MTEDRTPKALKKTRSWQNFEFQDLKKMVKDKIEILKVPDYIESTKVSSKVDAIQQSTPTLDVVVPQQKLIEHPKRAQAT